MTSDDVPNPHTSCMIISLEETRPTMDETIGGADFGVEVNVARCQRALTRTFISVQALLQDTSLHPSSTD